MRGEEGLWPEFSLSTASSAPPLARQGPVVDLRVAARCCSLFGCNSFFNHGGTEGRRRGQIRRGPLGEDGTAGGLPSVPHSPSFYSVSPLARQGPVVDLGVAARCCGLFGCNSFFNHGGTEERRKELRGEEGLWTEFSLSNGSSAPPLARQGPVVDLRVSARCCSLFGCNSFLNHGGTEGRRKGLEERRGALARILPAYLFLRSSVGPAGPRG